MTEVGTPTSPVRGKRPARSYSKGLRRRRSAGAAVPPHRWVLSPRVARPRSAQGSSANPSHRSVSHSPDKVERSPSSLRYAVLTVSQRPYACRQTAWRSPVAPWASSSWNPSSRASWPYVHPPDRRLGNTATRRTSHLRLTLAGRPLLGVAAYSLSCLAVMPVRVR